MLDAIAGSVSERPLNEELDRLECQQRDIDHAVRRKRRGDG
jgi:hypothetical protein